jgi:hypothetical protein
VRRVIGDDYWLKVVASPSYPGEVGAELPLRRWYSRMKETISLIPVSDPAVTLEEGERLYLASRRVMLAAEADDPLFFGNEGSPPAKSARSPAPFAGGLGAPADRATPRNKQEVSRGRVGPGRFFLTNRRLIWLGEDGRERAFPLERLNSAYALFNVALLILYKTRLYQARFLQESLLKWITYFAYVAEEVKATTGHLITTSKY